MQWHRTILYRREEIGLTTVPSIQVGRTRVKGAHRAMGAAMIALMFGLSACSGVPDAINPAKWYSWATDSSPDDSADVVDDGSDLSNVAPGSADNTGVNGPNQRAADGLVGDSQNSRYAPAVSREVTPTKPLVRRTQTQAEAQMVAAAETSQQQAPGAPSTPAPGAGAQTARANLSPSAPPATAPNMTPPARPDIPDQVAPVRRNTLMDHYHQRLMESGSPTVAQATPAVANGSASSGNGYAPASYGKPVHLTPPKSYASGAVSSGPELSVGENGSSFLLASLEFRNGSSQLSASDIESLREVARQYRKTGGIIRILGLDTGMAPVATPRTIVIGGGSVSSAQASATPLARADAVSRELARLGVPASRIMVGAVAPGTPAAADGAAARVYLDM